MPNWCMNDVLISGPKEKIENFYYEVMESGGLLETMVPKGEWDYDTAVEAWGTKWDVDPENLVIEFDKDDAIISGTVDSAWGPPIEAFKTFLSDNPECVAEIRYHEGGMEFIGMFTDGKDEYFEYNSNDLDSLKPIPKELIEHFNLEEELQEQFDMAEENEVWEDEY